MVTLAGVGASRNVLVIPGYETVIWWGVHVPLLSAVFGIVGVLLGHVIAPVIGPPLPQHRQAAVIAGGILISLSITMLTGQKPLVVASWSLGIGFAGITIFQTMGKQARVGLKSFGELVIEKLSKPDGEEGK